MAKNTWDGLQLAVVAAASLAIAAFLFIDWSGRGSAFSIALGDRPALSAARGPSVFHSRAGDSKSPVVQASALGAGAHAAHPGGSAPAAASSSYGIPDTAQPAGGDRLMVVGGAEAIGAKEKSSAFAANAVDAPAAGGNSDPEQAPADVSAPKKSREVAARSAPIRYGASDRSQIMGRGAGPVYNLDNDLSGKKLAPQLNKAIKQTGTMMESTRRHAVSLPLDPYSQQQLNGATEAAQKQIDAAGEIKVE